MVNLNLLKLTFFYDHYRYLNILELDEDECIDDDLPEGWIKCKHDSGMPVYLNEEMKVCSFSKPYFLGVNSLKVRINILISLYI